jgi:hypothetical protein
MWVLMVNIKLHSLTDLITNSSTVIYTYSENSLEPCKEMINAMLKALGSEKLCDDIFDIKVELEDPKDLYRSVYSQCNREQLPEEIKVLINNWNGWEQLEEAIDKIISQYRQGLIEKPYFLKEIEDIGFHYSPRKDTELKITPKDPKYRELAEKIVDFLYSTTHDSYLDN